MIEQDVISQYLTVIFPGKDVSRAEIVRIGGMSNKNFRIGLEGKQYVLRVPGPASGEMIDRANEEFNAFVGCRLGVNPEIRYFNVRTGIKLADYVENAETLTAATIQEPGNLRKIAEIYNRIHHSGVQLRNEFNIFREMEKYDRLIRNAHAVMYAGWEGFRPLVMALESWLEGMGVELCACHNDAVPENFIKDGDGAFYLIDWEYSGMNDPMADLAALFLESEFMDDSREYFMRQYFHGVIPPGVEERILCYEILWDTLWAQWTVIKEACGDDFGSYGIDRYNRAQKNYEKLITL